MFTEDVMTANLVTITPRSSLQEEAKKMQMHNIGGPPVYDGKKLHRIITDRDLTIRAIANGNAFVRLNKCSKKN